MKSIKNITSTKVQIGLIILSMIFLNVNIFAQTNEWKTEITKDGKITVSSNISKRTDENGDEVHVIEYVATTTISISMQNCISVLKDVSKHKEFTDDKISKIVETISENEWVVYYYTNSPWPISDSDLVTKMTLFEDEINKTVTFTLTAEPTMFGIQDVKRMTYYDVKYAFKDLGNGEVEMIVTGKMSPVVQVPGWLLRGIFPEGPADTLREIIKLANNL